jgi:isochorismate synthase
VKLSLKKFQQYCLKHRVAFVSYSLPGGNTPVTLFSSGQEIKTYNRISDIEESNGFLLSPFQLEDFPVVVIPNQNNSEGWELNVKELPQPSSNKDNHSFNMDEAASAFQRYAGQVDAIKQSIEAGEAKKVVLSRTKIWQDIDDALLPDVFEEMTNRYASAFVYLVYTPQSGVWLGATPESLLEINRSSFSTMALAGTKGLSGVTKSVTWTEKEFKEHGYVADYVRKKLTLGGFPFQELERETVRAGNVVHLRTMFKGAVDGDRAIWKKLVDLLYPTPAICGTENEATLQLIRKVEKHKREYYTGIIGPFDEMDRTNLFINLRCMKVTGNSALLFAGGGILGESTAVKEWEETEMKFNTLIQVIQKVKEKIKINE